MMMPNPQLEDGYVNVANELLEAFCRVSLTAYEWRILHALIRLTYGYHRKSITLEGMIKKEFYRLVQLSRQNVYRTLKMLKTQNMIVVSRDYKNHITLEIQKNYGRWVLSSFQTTFENESFQTTFVENESSQTTPVVISDYKSESSQTTPVVISDYKGGHNISNPLRNSDPKYNLNIKKNNLKKSAHAREEINPSFSFNEKDKKKAEEIMISVGDEISLPEPQRKDPKKMLEEFEVFRKKEGI
jgi:phage replication O-like protein O